jgi:hypothetical protein
MSLEASLDCFVKSTVIILSWPLVVASPRLPGFTVPLYRTKHQQPRQIFLFFLLFLLWAEGEDK